MFGLGSLAIFLSIAAVLLGQRGKDSPGVRTGSHLLSWTARGLSWTGRHLRDSIRGAHGESGFAHDHAGDSAAGRDHPR